VGGLPAPESRGLNFQVQAMMMISSFFEKSFAIFRNLPARQAAWKEQNG
jgi:hypothetical protein